MSAYTLKNEQCVLQFLSTFKSKSLSVLRSLMLSFKLLTLFASLEFRFAEPAVF